MMPVTSLAAISEVSSDEDLSQIGKLTNEALNAEIATRVERANNVAITRVLDELGLEIAQKVLGKAEKLSGDEEDSAVLTVTCADGHVVIPGTGAILVNIDRDPLQIHNFLNGKSWGDFVAGERRADMLVPCAVSFSTSSNDFHDIHGQQHGGMAGWGFSEGDERDDSVGGLRVKEFMPDSKLNPDIVASLTEEGVKNDKKLARMFGQARFLVLGRLATGAADITDTGRPVESFEHTDPKTGNTSNVRVEVNDKGKTGLIDEKGAKVTLSVADVAVLFPKFFSGGPESGGTLSGVMALESDGYSDHVAMEVEAKVISTDILDANAKELLEVGDPNKPLVETFLLDEKSRPISALNRFLLDELKEPAIADKVKFRPIIHTDPTGADKHNFVFMETMLYDHLRRPDFEKHNVGDRRGRNLTPVVMSRDVLVFRDDFMAGKIPEMGKSYIIMVKKADSWKVGRFTNAQEIDDWISE